MKRVSLFFVLAIFCAAFFISSGTAWGQATTSLRGTVTDPSGAAIPNATARLINTDTNLQRTTTTDAQGSYVFSQVQPGHYSLQIGATGFSRFEQKGIELLVNLPATVNVKMQIGAATQTVTVTEQAPLLNTTDSSLGQTMEKSEIQALPLEEGNVVQLLSLQPGVVYTTNRTDLNQFNSPNDTRSGAVDGERSDQSNVTLDGVDVNDQGNGYAFTSVLPVTVDSVQEFRVTTSNYGADQGRSAGGEVALVTTGGTNKLHGDAYEINRTALGEANDFFLKNAEGAQGQPNHPPQLAHNVFGASVGGPVKKDRFFYFLSYQGQRFADASSEVRTVPTNSLRDGIITYQCDPADPNFSSKCSGSSVTGLSGKTYSVAPGNFALNATQIAGMDPLGIGPNTATMAYFNTYPSPNDTTVGDGFNFSGFRFAAPLHAHDDWLIGRLDYKLTANGKHQLFWRGSGRDDVDDVTAPFLPGQSAEVRQVNLSKGMAIGYTAILGPNLVNNFRYGLTRQSISNAGDSNLPWIFIRNLSQGITRTNSFNFPVNNIVDDVSWTKGTHSISFGTNIDLVHNGSISESSSFSDGIANASWLDTSGIAGTSSPLDPANNGYPAVASTFTNSYDFPLMGLMGIVSEVDASYNFHVNSNGTGSPFAQGAAVPHHYALYDYEFYVQDSWKIKSNLTFNYGLRYQLITPPWETKGQEVAPTMNLGKWFGQRQANMLQGIPSNQDPLVSFDLAGRSNGRPDLWPTQNKDFAPRVSIAWSPAPSASWLQRLFGNGSQSVIRAGFGMYYDNFGQGMLSTFVNSGGSFGLSSTLSNPAGLQSVGAPSCSQCGTAARVGANMNTIPTTNLSNQTVFTPPPPATFPQTFPSTLSTGGFCICWGLDSSIKSPYSYALNLSFQRELPGNMSIEIGYVGHLGHRLLAQDDLAMPLDIVDKASGLDYFSAVTALAKVYRTGKTSQSFTPSMVSPAVSQYWADMLQPLQPGGAYQMSSCTGGAGAIGTTSPVTAMYDLFCGGSTNETTPLFVWDYFGIPDNNNSSVSYFPAGGPNSFFNPQYSSLYAWRSIGFSHYHALQVTLHKRMSHGLRFDLNYVFSRSIDIASDAERVGAWGGLGGNIINAWSPYQLKGVSDFNLTHQINANWTLDLPFGQGRAFGKDIGKGLDAVIGGWELSGITRWSSGFPVNVAHGFEWPTNWQLSGEANTVARPPTGKTVIGGNWNMFTNQAKGLAAFDYPFPGQSGARNAITGDGFLNTDMTLAKIWKMPYNENHSLELRWDVFNVFNTKRFDVQTAQLELDSASNFGDYTHLLTNPRQMEFGLRYQF